MVLNSVADVAVDSKGNLVAIVRGEIPVLAFSSEGRFLYGWGRVVLAAPMA